MKILFLILLMVAVKVNALSIDTDQEAPDTIIDSHSTQLYGGWLFEGGFSSSSFSGINPEYRVSQGDTLLLQIWGGIDFQSETKVDPQGNIFVPKVGPIKVLGVTNKDLNKVVLKAVKRVYKSNVEAYVTLLSSQKVKVFLSGLVKKPGLYEGQSADSLLKFIDQAGGIRRDIGSLRKIALKRSNKTLFNLDLYDFIENGNLPAIQLQDGDVIFIAPKTGEITIEGDVGFSGKYELEKAEVELGRVLKAVVPSEQATHVTIVESMVENETSNKKQVDAKQYALTEIKGIKVKAGALIKVSSQLRANSISVDVTGEHDSAYEMVLPWGASLKDLLGQIKYTRLSNESAVQLYRKSVAARQKDMLMASLAALEQSVLTARSATNEGAQLRKAEAEIIIQWIEKAKKVEPKGQVLLSDGYDASKIILQQGDRIVVPSKRNLVMVHGEVLFPTAIAYNDELDTQDFINHAGGTTADVDDMNILIMKPNGTFKNMNNDLGDEDEISPGDEIFVLAKPDVKSLQITKDIMQVIYQVAVSAAVVLTL
ncbi:MAG: polysaccharide export protein [Oceanospirillaceae bacterium]|nr:polysaccharide export protein [Oceanospirillaceae bacterium]